MGVFLELIIAKRFASKIPQYSRVEEKKKKSAYTEVNKNFPDLFRN